LANLDPGDPASSGAAENFVTFHIDGVGFIMERRHFYAAIYRRQSTDLSRSSGSRSVPYIHEVLNFENRQVVMFNLDELLMDLFHLNDSGTIKVAIIAGLQIFDEGHRDSVVGMLADNFEACAGDAFAFRISSDGAIRGMDWGDLKLLPAGLRNFLSARGLMACRFVGDGMEFVIDPGVLVFPSLSNPALEVQS